MIHRRPTVLLCGGLLLSALAAAEEAPALSADAIVARSEERTKSETERTTYEMELVDPSGKVEQQRTFEVFFKRDSEREVTLQKFLSPPVLEDSGMMIVDTGKAINDIWMYLPATRRLRRISGAEKSNWYMGTQFTYEDFEDYQIGAYSFTLREEAACGDGASCWVIEAVAAADSERKASGYGKKVYRIEKESLYPLEVDYFDRDGHETKRLTVSGLAKSGEYWRPAEIVMDDLESGRRTRIRAVERELDAPLDDYYVSNRYLRKD